jgi:glycolate oxidase iron-sulfur subunit
MALLFRRLLLDHRKMARIVRLAAFGKNSSVNTWVQALGLLKWFGKDLDKIEGIIERFPKRFFRERLTDHPLDPQPPKPTLAYFVGCGFNFVLPQVSDATLDMLAHVGTRTRIADNCCCGLPAFSYGDLDGARAAAAKNMDVLEKLDGETIVTDCGSCASFLKSYPELFENDPHMMARAERVAARVKGFSEFIHERLGSGGPPKSMKATVTYHDPCHMSRYQNIVSEPRKILSKLGGITYKELPEADRCCGAAGSYNIMHYDKSMRVLDRKMEALKRVGADILTTECPGCLIQLDYGVRRSGLHVRVLHMSQLLREVYFKKGQGVEGKNRGFKDPRIQGSE